MHATQGLTATNVTLVQQFGTILFCAIHSYANTINYKAISVVVHPLMMCRPQQTSERGLITKGPSWGEEEVASWVTSSLPQTRAAVVASAQTFWGEDLCGSRWEVISA